MTSGWIKAIKMKKIGGVGVSVTGEYFKRLYPAFSGWHVKRINF